MRSFPPATDHSHMPNAAAHAATETPVTEWLRPGSGRQPTSTTFIDLQATSSHQGDQAQFRPTGAPRSGECISKRQQPGSGTAGEYSNPAVRHQPHPTPCKLLSCANDLHRPACASFTPRRSLVRPSQSVATRANRQNLACTGELFIENQYDNGECDYNEYCNDRDQDGVRADVNSADTSQDTIDKGKKCPSARVSMLRRGRLGRLRRGRNRNDIVHDDPFDQGAHDCRANISLVGRQAMARMLAGQIGSSKSF